MTEWAGLNPCRKCGSTTPPEPFTWECDCCEGLQCVDCGQRFGGVNDGCEPAFDIEDLSDAEHHRIWVAALSAAWNTGA